jgi:hypothetical protein
MMKTEEALAMIGGHVDEELLEGGVSRRPLAAHTDEKGPIDIGIDIHD